MYKFVLLVLALVAVAAADIYPYWGGMYDSGLYRSGYYSGYPAYTGYGYPYGDLFYKK